MKEWKIPKPENKQLGAEQIYSATDEQFLRLGCVSCFAFIETTVNEITADNHLACPECMSTRDVDVADLMRRREIIKKAVAGHKKTGNL